MTRRSFDWSSLREMLGTARVAQRNAREGRSMDMPYRSPDAERLNELAKQAEELAEVSNEARGRRRRAAVIAGGVVASWLAVILLAASQGT